MGLLATISAPLERLVETLPLWQIVLLGFPAFIFLAVVLNVLSQLLIRNPNEPPVVFHWIPIIGSTISYGIDPFPFFNSCREKYGDVFTFILLGKKTTVCLGTQGNEFILNGKLKDVCAEEIYTPLTTPVFGKDVVYDCPNSKLMEQKKFVKFGLTLEAFKSYVALIEHEVVSFIERSPVFQGQSGTCEATRTLAEITIYTASRSLQGKEIRGRFDSTFVDLYHDLDMGFSPINFMLSWAPLPHNRKRDIAQRKMAQTYMEIIQERRKAGAEKTEEDMIWNLMSCVYKDGKPAPDHEIAHMMIALLMAGQHSSSSTSAWMIIRLATRPDIQDDLVKEQQEVLRGAPLTYENLNKLQFHAKVVKETLRLHAPIHSILRKVKSPLSITADTPSGTKTYIIPTTHVLLSAPGVTMRQENYFPEPMLWEPHRWDHGHPLAFNQDIEAPEELYDYGYGMISKGAQSPYLPFGAGRHRCIGEQFAYVQLQTVVATIVKRLKFKNPEDREGIVATDFSSLFSRPMAPAPVKWEKREATSEKSEKE